MHASTFNKWHKKKKKKKKHKNKKVTLHKLTHGTMRGRGIDFFGGLNQSQNLWYKREKCDNKEWDLNYEHPLPRVSGYLRVSDITEVDITGV
jgi:hypothetical protein